MSQTHSLVCIECNQLIVPPALAAPRSNSVLDFGPALDPMVEAFMRHLAEAHSAELANIMNAATLFTVYLASAYAEPVTDWPEWETLRNSQAEALALIFNSADAEPGESENPSLQKGASEGRSQTVDSARAAGA